MVMLVRCPPDTGVILGCAFYKSTPVRPGCAQYCSREGFVPKTVTVAKTGTRYSGRC
jgi:hypothetical protein